MEGCHEKGAHREQGRDCLPHYPRMLTSRAATPPGIVDYRASIRRTGLGQADAEK
jgi:hypothetical protein